MKLPAIVLFLLSSLWSLKTLGDNALPDCKMGKFSPEDLKMKTYEPDTNAAAIILANQAEASVNDEGGVQIDCFERIKVIHKNNYSLDFEVPVGSKDGLTGLKVVTYNFENGAVIPTDIDKKNVFVETVDANHFVQKFSPSDVKDGSIIEVKYTTFTGHIPTWYFEDDIPVKYSDFTVSFPDYFYYKIAMYGDVSFTQLDQVISKVPAFENVSGPKAYLLKDDIQNTQGNYQEKRYRYIAVNIPAFKTEPFMKCPNDYQSRVRYELTSYTPPGGFEHDFNTTWEEVAQNLYDSPDFGDQLKSGNAMDEIVNKICGSTKDPGEKLNRIFAYVKTELSWNGIKTLYAGKSAHDLLKDKEGNSADINLFLISLLRSAGINASPLVLRTTEFGPLNLLDPGIQNLNYVVAAAKMDSDLILLDATSPYNAVGQLPLECLNGKGLILEDLGWYSGNHSIKTEEVDLSPRVPSKKIATYDLTIDDEGNLVGRMDEKYCDYYALAFRQSFKTAKSKDEFAKDMEKLNTGLEIDSLSMQDLDSTDQPVKAAYKISIRDKAQQIGNLIAIPSSMFETEDESDYRLENRKYPVEYMFPYEKDYVIKVSLPDGYAIDSLPQPIIYSLPNDAGKFSYNVSSLGSSVLIVGRLTMFQTLFMPNDYADLRAFFNHVIQKQSEMILVKK